MHIPGDPQSVHLSNATTTAKIDNIYRLALLAKVEDGALHKYSLLVLVLLFLLFLLLLDEQRSQKPTSLLAFPKFSAVAFYSSGEIYYPLTKQLSQSNMYYYYYYYHYYYYYDIVRQKWFVRMTLKNIRLKSGNRCFAQ